MERNEILGFAVLFVGVGLLIFTFSSAYGFLREERSIAGSADLIRTFGETLAPLAKAAINAIYLGVMGWVGSMMTMRGVQVVTGLRKEKKAEAKKEAETAPG